MQPERKGPITADRSGPRESLMAGDTGPSAIGKGPEYHDEPYLDHDGEGDGAGAPVRRRGRRTATRFRLG